MAEGQDNELTPLERRRTTGSLNPGSCTQHEA
jgi:hypothetical protein